MMSTAHEEIIMPASAPADSPPSSILKSITKIIISIRSDFIEHLKEGKDHEKVQERTCLV